MAQSNLCIRFVFWTRIVGSFKEHLTCLNFRCCYSQHWSLNKLSNEYSIKINSLEFIDQNKPRFAVVVITGTHKTYLCIFEINLIAGLFSMCHQIELHFPHKSPARNLITTRHSRANITVEPRFVPWWTTNRLCLPQISSSWVAVLWLYLLHWIWTGVFQRKR